MKGQKRYDLIISGVGSSSGGIFENLLIDGVGTITGNVDCVEFAISGVGTVEGNVKAITGKISGRGVIKGTLLAEEFRLNGHAKMGGVEVQKIRFEGVAGIEGSITADLVENNGVIRVKGDCQSEAFLSRGAFDIGGLLNAGNIDISLYAPCKAQEIGGEKIQVNMGHSFSIRRLIKSVFPSLAINTGLCSETIEGDEIYLEHTKAKVVRGNNITIGECCEIQLVEYKGRFEKSNKSKVTDHKKLS